MPRRPLLTVTLFFTVLALIFMGRVLWPPAGQALAGHDARALFVPWLAFARDALLNGRLPLWDASQFAGYPFLSNPQVALFYPPTWLILLLPVHIGLSWHVLLHIVVAGLGMFLFVRQQSHSQRAALLAAVAFAFSGFWAARIWAGHVGLLATNAWLPWLLWSTAWAHQRRNLWTAVVAALPWALAILAGHTASLLYIALVWGLFALYLFLNGRRWTLWLQLSIMAGVGLLLSAVQLLPLAQFTAVAARTEEASLAFATQFSFPPTHLITLLLPQFFGEPTHVGYWSVPAFDELTYYAGVLVLVGIGLGLRRPSRLVYFYLGLIALGLLLAFGSYGFLYEIFYQFLPPFRLARAPARAAFLYVFAAPALLGEAIAVWEKKSDGLAPLMRWLLATAVVTGLAALAATATVFATYHPSDTSGRQWQQIGGWGLATGLFVMGGWLLWRYLSRPTAVTAQRRPWFAALLLLLIADLWLFGWKFVQLGPTAVHPLWSDAQAIIGHTDERVLPWGISIFEQNGAANVGLSSVFGYNALEVGANAAFTGSIPDPRASSYDILSVRYVLAQTPLDSYLDGPRPLRLVGQSEHVWVYERAQWQPLVRLLGQYEVLPDAATAVARVHQPDFDPATHAILAAEPACQLGQGPVEGQATILAQEPGYWRIQTNSDAPALLVLSETAYPGWQVRVDGQPAPNLDAYTAVRAVCVPAGEHIVEWQFTGQIFLVGGLISLLTSLFVAFAWAKVRRLPALP